MNNSVSQKFAKILKSPGRLTNEERLLFCHEYFNRYNQRLMSPAEFQQFSFNRRLEKGTDSIVSILMPFTLFLMLLTHYDFHRFILRCNQATGCTVVATFFWLCSVKKQNDFLNQLSHKYFGEMSDEMLVRFDRE